ncbi:MAG: hypothetical protein IKW00_01215 [Clostridia bacterium]|nr:hypothetical protein [Clostridia bacterium]
MQKILFSAAEFCTEFVYVLQPDFDKNLYLFDKKLKTYYSDWSSHTAQMTSYDFFRICKRLREGGTIKDFVIFKAHPIRRSSDPRIHPIDSPINQHEYDRSKHPVKPMHIRLKDVYENIGLLLILKDDFSADDSLKKICRGGKVIYDSRNIKNI